MKKTIATLLAFMLIASFCGTMLASADTEDTAEELSQTDSQSDVQSDDDSASVPDAESADGGEASDKPEEDSVTEYTNKLAGLVGADRESADFDLVLNSTVDAEGLITVTMTVSNIKDGVGMQALFAKLVYDDERMELVTGLNEDEALDILTTAPSNKWENLSAVLLEENEDGEKIPTNVININLFVASDDTTITADAPLVATIQFRLKENCTYGGVYAATDTVDSTGFDETTEKFVNYYGNGAYTTAVMEVKDPSGTESSAPSDEVPAGDSSIILFAVLGMIAIAGVTAASKVRH